MLFATHDPYIEKDEVIYYNGKRINAEEPIKCFICFFTQNECIFQIHQMRWFYKYYKNCQCDALVHTTCLDEWIKLTHSCPICRKPVLLKYDYHYRALTNVAQGNITLCGIFLFFTRIYSIYFVVYLLFVTYAIYFVTNLLLYVFEI